MGGLRIKYMCRNERAARLKQIFDAQVISEPEANRATQIALFLEDVLSALPESAKKEHVASIFECALNQWR